MAAARVLLTVAEAAEALGVSDRHIKRLVAEADANRKSRWRWGRELIDLAPVDSQRRMVRINVSAIAPLRPGEHG
jgi:excisionase family DNA binding protein